MRLGNLGTVIDHTWLLLMLTLVVRPLLLLIVGVLALVRALLLVTVVSLGLLLLLVVHALALLGTLGLILLVALLLLLGASAVALLGTLLRLIVFVVVSLTFIVTLMWRWSLIMLHIELGNTCWLLLLR